MGLDASGQEDVPGQQGGALGVAFALVRSTDVLGTGVGTTGVSQTEVDGQSSHDAGGRDLAVDGVGDEVDVLAV